MAPSGLIRSRKQKIIMSLVLRAAGEGTFHNVSELHALLPYSCAYGSFRRSLEHLEKHEIIAKEKAGNFTLIKPTTKAYTLFTTGG